MEEIQTEQAPVPDDTDLEESTLSSDQSVIIQGIERPKRAAVEFLQFPEGVESDFGPNLYRHGWIVCSSSYSHGPLFFLADSRSTRISENYPDALQKMQQSRSCKTSNAALRGSERS